MAVEVTFFSADRRVPEEEDDPGCGRRIGAPGAAG